MLRRLTITFTAAERAALDRRRNRISGPSKIQARALVRAEAERRCLWYDDPASANYRGGLIPRTLAELRDDCRGRRE